MIPGGRWRGRNPLCQSFSVMKLPLSPREVLSDVLFIAMGVTGHRLRGAAECRVADRSRAPASKSGRRMRVSVAPS